ncbi:enoyl-CoA hydratase/isomerase family protein [Pigmentiphaga sp.]|uniref:enoyl-CoA hydratase/isomerase family protein n=1 Tax=Pigmentiphaga sp. TaxID=1977564 RepID=UPI0025E3EDDA|nr:enoyl-CoA hydratase/isomerase family protein [Pigmentiphaga sp.]MBX6318703.1 enoyl-CoA hydratase/isomerase family protein [Pigmentiphaga sp.]
MSELLIENRGAVRVLTMNRPEKHNALNTPLTQALLDALRQADADAGVNAVVLTGAGKSFCAGADTSEFSTLVPEDPHAVNARADLTTNLHMVFSRMSKPVVAAVRGNALGGGAGLAIACDLTVMAENVRFGYPELKHGIVAAVVMSNLVRQLGRKHAFELLTMGEPINGARALELGLANRVAPEDKVLDVALEMAEKLASWSPIAMGTTKRLFHRVAELTLEEGLAAGRDVNVIMRGFRKAAK